ncbi:MAG TPA: isoprenyl transferase [Bacteroidales bacterium]|nr:isoprenyl transferase [Bacteroidales bacterium]HPS71137.1 isoprenyl transferase [Bacteroidales bacterium]
MVQNIDRSKIPSHIAIIMDGNGRWAVEKGQDRIYGHQNAIDAVRSVIEGAGEIGVKYLTLFSFSSENWNRPKNEVDALMSLFVKCIHSEMNTLMENKVKLLAIGDLNTLPEDCQSELHDALEQTKNNSGLSLVLALSYSSRNELTHAMKLISQKIKNNILQPEDINENTIQLHLYTHEIPDPDILIRTGREQRISNFLLWQLSYTELFFSPILWPDFRKEDLWSIISEFQNRERRFGKTSEQLINQ